MMTLSTAWRSIAVATMMVWVAAQSPGAAGAVPAEDLTKMAAAAPARPYATPQAPRKLLVFSRTAGFRHSSIPHGIEALRILGEKTGAFTIEATEDPAVFEAGSLSRFDAVCFLNTTQSPFQDDTLKANLASFIKSGKGFVGIHAATDTFYDWPVYGEMIGAYFVNHPWHEKVTLKVEDTGHACNQCFDSDRFQVVDEIYQFRAEPYSRTKARILTSLDTDLTNMDKNGIQRDDNDFAVSWVKTFGQGRVFYCSLGHREDIYWNPTVLRHYLAGIQFAFGDLAADTTPSQAPATGDDALWQRIRGYEFGESRLDLTKVGDIVRESLGNEAQRAAVERKLIAVLESDATYACKQFICRQLWIAGTEQSVPTLARLLTDAQLSDMARYALQSNPSPAVTQAMIDAMGKARGPVLIGIINSLGERRDEQAISALERYARSDVLNLSHAAAAALGKIGGPRSAKILQSLPARTDPVIADAVLSAADSLLSGPNANKQAAITIYRSIYNDPAYDSPRRIAALRGLLVADPKSAADLVLKLLGDDDEQMRAVAAGFVRKLEGDAVTETFAARLGDLDPQGQTLLIAALADRNDLAALPAIMTAADSDSEQVRIAALTGLGSIDNADAAVALLAKAAGNSRGAEREAARASLARLRGSNIEALLLDQVGKGSAASQAEVISALAKRGATEATGKLITAGASGEDAVRVAAIEALGDLAGADHYTAIVDLLLKADSTRQRRAAEKAVIAVARKVENLENATGVLVNAIDQTDDETAGYLISALGTLGGERALTTVRELAGGDNTALKDAAVRALAGWPDPSPLEDLQRIASTTDNNVHRVLALRGYVRQAGLPSSRSSAETLRLYQQAMELAKTDEDRRLVLGGLASVAHPGALNLAEPLLRSDALKNEAALAVLGVARGIAGEDTQRAKQAIERVRSYVDDASINARADETLQFIERNEDYITSYLLSGPYMRQDTNATELHDIAFAPESDPGQAQWRPVTPNTNQPGLLDFTTMVGGDNRCVYVKAQIYVPAETRARLEMGSDDTLKAFLNGEVVFTFGNNRGHVAGQDKPEVTLKQGWNDLLLKICNGSGGWSVSCRVRQADGSQIEGLRFRAQ